jgi:hypothetical protein
VALISDGDAPSGFNLLNGIWQNGSFSLSISGRTNRSYLLQFKQSLSDPKWTDLTTVAGSTQPITLLDPGATNAQRFYRVRQQ